MLAPNSYNVCCTTGMSWTTTTPAATFRSGYQLFRPYVRMNWSTVSLLILLSIDEVWNLKMLREWHIILRRSVRSVVIPHWTQYSPCLIKESSEIWKFTKKMRRPGRLVLSITSDSTMHTLTEVYWVRNISMRHHGTVLINSFSSFHTHQFFFDTFSFTVAVTDTFLTLNGAGVFATNYDPMGLVLVSCKFFAIDLYHLSSSWSSNGSTGSRRCLHPSVSVPYRHSPMDPSRSSSTVRIIPFPLGLSQGVPGCCSDTGHRRTIVTLWCGRSSELRSPDISSHLSGLCYAPF